MHNTGIPLQSIYFEALMCLDVEQVYDFEPFPFHVDCDFIIQLKEV